MRNITLKTKSVLMLLCCLLGMSAWAQETEGPTVKVGETTVNVVSTFNPYVQVLAGTAYSGDVIGFNPAAVAEALGVGSITEATQYIVNADDSCVENTTDGWRDKDGNAAGWGSGEGMVCVKINDPASGVVDYIGTIDETYAKGDTYLARWAFVANNLAVVINVNIGFIEVNPTSVLVEGETVPVVGSETAMVDVFEKTVYTGDTGAFDASALASALGIERLSDAKAYILNMTSGECVENTTDGWRNGFGDAAGWGTSPSGVCVKIQDPDSGVIDYIGAIDETHVKGENAGYIAAWAFVANGKCVVVYTEIHFIQDPASLVVIPEVERSLAAVKVLGTVEVSSERYDTDGYETSLVEVQASGIAEALGIVSKEDLQTVFDQLIYVVGEDSIGCKGTELQLLTYTDGWLSQAVLNEDGMAGEQLDEVIGAPYAGNSKYYVQQMAYDAATDKVSFVVGQYPGNLRRGENWPVNLYVMWGDKAFVIHYTMNVIEPPVIGIEGMQQVGETIELTYTQNPTTDYSSVGILLDTQAAAEALGCDEASISLKALASENGFSALTTANNGGWWFNAEGFVTSYGGGSAFFIEPAESGVYSVLNMGQMPGVLGADDSVSTYLYLVNGDKYVKYHIVLNITEKQVGEWETWHSVATRVLNIQQVANDGYVWSEKAASISASELVSLIGTSSPELYGRVSPDALEEGACPYTNDYTMGEKPGFWLTTEGYPTTWGNNSTWGITSQASTTGIADGWGFKAMQFPGSGVVGNAFSGTFYLVNVETGDMLTVILNSSVVEEVVEADLVGSAELAVAVSNEDFVQPYDLAEIAEAIGYESVSAMGEDEVMFGLTASGAYSEPIALGAWLSMDTEGNVVNEEDGQIFLYFENGMVCVSCNDFEPQPDWKRSVEVFFENPATGKRFLLVVTLLSKEGYDGIGKVAAKAAATTTYDLSGRKVGKQLGKGIYIINNKLVVNN